jgi:sulfoxide reductase heme-binding subunit YedZ
MQSRQQLARAAQLASITIALVPALILAVDFSRDALGANPVEELTHRTGLYALRFLLASLAITPARRWLGFAWLAPLRRTLGLAAFAWACAHVAIFAWLDHGLALGEMWDDLLERRYITAGSAAWLLLVPLAATSTRAMQQRLGRRWQSLHRLVYLAAGTAVLHFIWLVKADLREPIVYGSILSLLLALRWNRRELAQRPLSP